MPRPRRQGQMQASAGDSGGGGGGIVSKLKALFGGGQVGDFAQNPNFDPSFDPTKEGAYATTKFGYDPSIDYTKPFSDTRSGFLSGLRPDVAEQLNQQVMLSKAQIPNQVALQQGLGDVQNKQALDALTQKTNFADTLYGKGAAAGLGNQIPFSAIPSGAGSNYADIGNALRALYGSQAEATGLTTAIPNAAQSVARANLGTAEAQGALPFGKQQGATGMQAQIAQNQALADTAGPEARQKLDLGNANIGLIKTRTQAERMVPGGFQLGPNGEVQNYLNAPKDLLIDEPMIVPDGKGGFINTGFTKTGHKITAPSVSPFASTDNKYKPFSSEEVDSALGNSNVGSRANALTPTAISGISKRIAPIATASGANPNPRAGIQPSNGAALLSKPSTPTPASMTQDAIKAEIKRLQKLMSQQVYPQ